MTRTESTLCERRILWKAVWRMMWRDVSVVAMKTSALVDIRLQRVKAMWVCLGVMCGRLVGCG